MALIVAFSGGKDSTAMALRLHELGEPFKLLFTETGNELPEVLVHIADVVARTQAELVRPSAPTLFELIEKFDALPNWRQRWCTRMIKILPCIAYLKAHPGSVLAVGLRADEEDRQGLYGDFATYRYPLQEWGWRMKDVLTYVKAQSINVPKRTDCALCYGQRLGEWYALWKDHPARYAEGEALEAKTGFTFRSPGRDTWPANLALLRAEFEKGRVPRGGAEDRRGPSSLSRVQILNTCHGGLNAAPSTADPAEHDMEGCRTSPRARPPDVDCARRHHRVHGRRADAVRSASGRDRGAP